MNVEKFITKFHFVTPNDTEIIHCFLIYAFESDTALQIKFKYKKSASISIFSLKSIRSKVLERTNVNRALIEIKIYKSFDIADILTLEFSESPEKHKSIDFISKNNFTVSSTSYI